jgi:predicted secreted hydrolase
MAMGTTCIDVIRSRLALSVLMAAAIGCCPDAFYEKTTENPTVRLPLDEAPHCYGGEWWYYTGRLMTDDGRGYGIEAVIFHAARVPLTPVVDEWAAHFAVLDETTGEFVYEQTRKFGPKSIGGPEPGGFDLKTDLIQMMGEEGHDHILAEMQDGPYAVDLTVEDQRGPVLHGNGGYVPYGQDDMCFYYSRPTMEATGTMQIDGEEHVVTGQLWFDRQWGSAINTPWKKWDWFSLRLDDGTNVMLFVFRDKTNPVAFGTYIPAEGEPVALSGDDFEITSTASWKSPHTGITYPAAWQIHIIPQDVTVAVTALFGDQELNVLKSTLNIYWEGLCNVSGTRGSEDISGYAYVELTNYPLFPR